MINIGICGYGNLGKACSEVIKYFPNLNLVGIFTKRNVNCFNITNIYHVSKLEEFKDKIDVLLLCGGSKNHLVIESVKYAKDFNIVDTYDTHELILKYYKRVDKILREENKVGLVSTGWDPGLFSLAKMMNDSILPNSTTNVFWGNGVSQGHSDAIRQIKGVVDATAYTICNSNLLNDARQNKKITGNKHIRQCYVVIDKLSDENKIRDEIVNMPYYFLGSKTVVEFVSFDELVKKHKTFFHAGNVISTNSINGINTKIEYNLNLDSNPMFTAYVMLSYAKAVYRLSKEGVVGCKTILDIPPSYISDYTGDELIEKYL